MVTRQFHKLRLKSGLVRPAGRGTSALTKRQEGNPRFKKVRRQRGTLASQLDSGGSLSL